MESTASSQGYQPKIVWHAIYKDNSILSQHEQHLEHSSEQIDKRRLKKFLLTSRDGSQTILTIYPKKGQKLLYRARTILRAGQGVVDRIHIIVLEDQATQQWVFVHEIDQTINIGQPDSSPDTPWYWKIERLPHDEIEVE